MAASLLAYVQSAHRARRSLPCAAADPGAAIDRFITGSKVVTRARHQLQPALVLSTRAYRETSRLVEAFTAEQGRVGLVARGVRGPRSRLAALLQPLQPLLVSWTEGGDL